MSYVAKPAIERFLQKVAVVETGCWDWQASRLPKGYGRFSIPDGNCNSKSILAHVWAYEYYKGPSGALIVCHVCDNPSCVNPDHLFLGSYQDNSNDAMTKGRTCTKCKHWNAKLDDEQVRQIRDSIGLSQQQLATMYGVSRGHISQLRRNTRWKITQEN
jgi:predicted XRE-type DNA-binding protein